MKTNKSISNISYHTPHFFSQRVKELRENGTIPPCLWIYHKGESGDKEHIHFVLLGGYMSLNTEGLSSLFGTELIAGKPASVTNLWKSTKSLDDWILYAIHEPTYLLHKGETKEHHYNIDDIQYTDNMDELKQIIDSALDSLNRQGDKVICKIKLLISQGLTFDDAVTMGAIPLAQIRNAQLAWSIISNYPLANASGK